MTQVRQVIELLTNVLKENGTSEVRAETFRLAKFDNDDVTVEMWKLLFEILYYSIYGRIDETAVKAMNEMSPSEIVVYVKRELQEIGYFSKEFARLPLSMEYGSREILLAFAWLLAKKSMFNRFVESCSSPLTGTKAAEMETQFMVQDETNKKFTCEQTLNDLTADQKLQQMVMLNGKLQNNLKKMYSTQRETAKLQHRVHEATLGVSLDPRTDHLSLSETLWVRHPSQLKKILCLLEDDNNRLKHLLEWRSKEDIFWKWMDSVLDLKSKEKEENNVKILKNNLAPKYYVRSDSSTMRENRELLRDTIMKYETIIDKLEDMWETRSSEIPQQELDGLISALDIEIAIHKAKLPFLEDGQTDTLNYCMPEFHFVPSSQQTRSNTNTSSYLTVDSPANLDIGSVESSSILTEINDLEWKINNIEADIENTQRFWKQKMQQYAVLIPQSLCIDPISKG